MGFGAPQTGENYFQMDNWKNGMMERWNIGLKKNEQIPIHDM